MAKITYETFRDRMRAELWPHPGEPKSLRTSHDTMFQNGMYELTKWVPSLRNNNTSVFPACDTYVQNALTLLEAVYGRIERVYTIATVDGALYWADPVYYEQRNFEELLRWSTLSVPLWTEPPNVALPTLQQGIKYSEDDSDEDFDRARRGVWALHRRRMYLAPWIHSNESVVVEWAGERRSWADADILDETYWTQDVETAIKSWVRWRHECEHGNAAPAGRRALRLEFDDFLAEAIYQDEQRTKLQPVTDPSIGRYPTTAEHVAQNLY